MSQNKENVTLIGFALDKSGSMGSNTGLWKAALSGTNEFVQTQDPSINTTLSPTKTLFGMVLFDTFAQWRTNTALFINEVNCLDEHEPSYVFTQISEFVPLTDDKYKPYGMTALYDAIEKLIIGVDLYIIDHPEQNINVILVIQTDGEENSSKRISVEKIRLDITERTAKGWKFTFLGADQDACLSAASIGISKASAVCYSNDADQTRQVMHTVSEAVCRHRNLSPYEQSHAQVSYTDNERELLSQQVTNT